MARRSDHSRDEIKQMAVQAGQKLLSEYGFRGFSARKVAKEIGYTIGTIYNVFASHEEFILHINVVTLMDMYDYIVRKTSCRDRRNDALIQLAEAYIDFSVDNYLRWNALFEFNLPRGIAYPLWYEEKVKQLFDLLEEPLLPLLDNRLELAKQATRVLWASIHGICQLGLTNKLATVAGDSVQVLAHSLITHYLQGLQLSIK